MKNLILIIIISNSSIIFGQSNDYKSLTSALINTIIKSDSISDKISDYPLYIKDYEFDGDYSFERIFGRKQVEIKVIDGDTVYYASTGPNVIRYKKPLKDVLKEIDLEYDELYYLKQIEQTEKKLGVKKKSILIRK